PVGRLRIGQADAVDRNAARVQPAAQRREVMRIERRPADVTDAQRLVHHACSAMQTYIIMFAQAQRPARTSQPAPGIVSSSETRRRFNNEVRLKPDATSMVRLKSDTTSIPVRLSFVVSGFPLSYGGQST